MPSDTEINEQKSAFPAMRVWGTWPSGMVEEVRWGDIAVIPFYDHVDAIKAAEQRVTDRHNAEHEDDRLAAFESGWEAALDGAVSAALPHLAALIRHACTADNWEQTDALIRRSVLAIKADITALHTKRQVD